MSTTPEFIKMTREQLSTWYVANVGYDLGTEDPAMTLDEYRGICAELHRLHNEEPA